MTTEPNANIEPILVLDPCDASPRHHPRAVVPSTERIYQAVRELRALEQIATRETVADLTGLKLSIVDDRLRALADEGRLKRLLRGVYELVEVYPPPRVISRTVLSDGHVVYDIGDLVVTLTPQEARVLAEMSVGAATTAVLIHSAREHMTLATDLAARLERLERLAAMEREKL